MNLIGLDWLKGVLSPSEFRSVTIVTGLSLLLSMGIFKLDKVIENQIIIRAENKRIDARIDEAISSCEFVKGQNSERTRFNSDFAKRLLRLENKAYSKNSAN